MLRHTHETARRESFRSTRPKDRGTNDRCACGRWPVFHCPKVAEDTVESFYRCACGVQSESVEDAYADRATARLLWDQMRRRAA